MTTVFFVNDARSVHPDRTTGRLIRTHAETAPTVLVSAHAAERGDDGLVLHGRPVDSALRTGPMEPLPLAAVDRILVRTNPATARRRWHPDFLLDLLEEAEAAGIPVVNAPGGLRRFGSKAGLLHLPASLRAPTRIAGTAEAVRAAVRGFGPSVLKPAVGSHGRGVFRVSPASPNLRAVAELLLETGPVVVQPWLPRAEEGDVRVLVVDGEVLRVRGRPVAIRRSPSADEHRSNVHLGGLATPTTPSAALVDVCTRAAGLVAAHGIRLAGLDCIGDRLIEVNVSSPGGLHDLEDLLDADVVAPCLRALCAAPR